MVYTIQPKSLSTHTYPSLPPEPDLRIELRTFRLQGGRTTTVLIRRTSNGIRIRAAAVKGRCPGPLDDRGKLIIGFQIKNLDL